MISKMVSQAPYVSLLTGAVLILLLTPWLAPAQTDPNQSIPNHSILGQQRQHVLQQALVGSWLAPVGDRQLELLLKSDGNFKLGAQTGSYHIQGLNLNLIMDETSMAYHLDKFVKNELTLSGGDLDAPLTFSKLPLTSLKVSLDNLGDKLVRLLSIILIIGLCRLLLWGLHGLLYFLVYSDAGALKHVHRLHKSRSMTLYSIILNASKYVVYVIGVGYVLGALGINYTTYLASLSVVGLAIGFGSQDLVKDMVTGLFIIFENQFDVGDVVELAGHVGTVEELGLRMTRLRTLTHQTVVIPNRNISVVTRYAKGRLEAHVDVALSPQAEVESMQALLRAVVTDVRSRFGHALLGFSDPIEIVTLPSGPHFARLHLSLWPNQQWVIDQQIIPGIRATCQAQNLIIPNDSIVTFYGGPTSKYLHQKLRLNPTPAWVQRWLPGQKR